MYSTDEMGTTSSTEQYRELLDEYSSKPQGYYEQSRREMIEYVPPSSRSILEIGCGTGGFGAALKEAIPGCEVWGIEPDAAAAGIAAKRLDVVINSLFSADARELSGQQFDAICFNDVLEHMIVPERALESCKALLSPNGVVVASIPNILFFYQIAEILIHQDWRYVDSGILDKTHLRFFTKKSIVRMFESCGYEISRIEGINSFRSTGSRFGWKYRVVNMLTLGRLSDWKYIHFAVQARSKRAS